MITKIKFLKVDLQKLQIFIIMGLVCSKTEVQEVQQALEIDYTQYTIEERIAEIQQFLSLSIQDTKPIFLKNQSHQKIDISDFQIEQYIGKGGYGKVYTAIHIQTGQIYAMKIIKKSKLKDQNTKLQTISEKLILQNVDHPFLVKLHFSFHNMAKIYMMVDYMEGGELFFLMRSKGKFTEDEARFYAAEIFLALQYLHNKNIMYRDLKPQNILLDLQGHVKITDFGISKVFDRNNNVTTFSMCGTPQYIAPQVLHNKGYSFSSDWFSFGALVYDMITGKPPFYSKNQLQIIEKKLDSCQISLPRKISPATRSFLSGLLNSKPQKRLGSKGSQQIKNHPFFSNINFDELLQKKIKPPIDITQTMQNFIFDGIQAKSSSLKSSFFAKSFKSKFDKELNALGFQYNKYNNQWQQTPTQQSNIKVQQNQESLFKME